MNQYIIVIFLKLDLILNQHKVGCLRDNSFVLTNTIEDGDGNGSAVIMTLFGNDGHQVGTETMVNTQIQGMQQDPSVAVLFNDNFVIAWESDGQDGNNQGIYAQIFDNKGNKVGNEFQVNTQTNNNQKSAEVTASLNGFWITWTSYNQDLQGYGGQGVFAQEFDSDGVKIGTEQQANVQAVSSQFQPSIATLQSGHAVVVWASSSQDSLQTYGIQGRILKSDSQEFLINTVTSEEQSDPSISVLKNGQFVVVWKSQNQDGSGYGIYGQRFTESFAKIADEFMINKTTIGHQQNPHVKGIHGGGFIVSWSHDNNSNVLSVQSQEYDLNGDKIGDELLVSSGIGIQKPGGNCGLVGGGQIIAIVSEDDSTIQAERFQNHERVQNGFIIPQYTNIPPISTTFAITIYESTFINFPNQIKDDLDQFVLLKIKLYSLPKYGLLEDSNYRLLKVGSLQSTYDIFYELFPRDSFNFQDSFTDSFSQSVIDRNESESHINTVIIYRPPTPPEIYDDSDIKSQLQINNDLIYDLSSKIIANDQINLENKNNIEILKKQNNELFMIVWIIFGSFIIVLSLIQLILQNMFNCKSLFKQLFQKNDHIEDAMDIDSENDQNENVNNGQNDDLSSDNDNINETSDAYDKVMRSLNDVQTGQNQEKDQSNKNI